VDDALVTVEWRGYRRPQQQRRVGLHRRSEALSDAHSDDAYPAFERPVRGGAIQALSREVLIQRSLQVSSSGFITIISIIQGVALALLAQNTFPSPSPLVGAQSVSLLLVFVAVFYFYLSLSVLLRWAPSFLDCFLPFVIAGLEIPPAFFLGNVAAWNGWLSALWLFTSAGLFITIKWSPPSHFGGDREAHAILHRMLHELQLVVGAGGVSAGLIALLAHLFPGGRSWWGLAGVLAVLATVAMVVARTEIRASQIHERYGVNRPPFN
jgi:hypothetical protein